MSEKYFDDATSVISLSSEISAPDQEVSTLSDRPWQHFSDDMRKQWEIMYANVTPYAIGGSWATTEEYQREKDMEMRRYLQDHPITHWLIPAPQAHNAYIQLVERERWRGFGIPIYGRDRLPEWVPGSNGSVRPAPSGGASHRQQPGGQPIPGPPHQQPRPNLLQHQQLPPNFPQHQQPPTNFPQHLQPQPSSMSQPVPLRSAPPQHLQHSIPLPMQRSMQESMALQGQHPMMRNHMAPHLGPSVYSQGPGMQQTPPLSLPLRPMNHGPAPSGIGNPVGTPQQIPYGMPGPGFVHYMGAPGLQAPRALPILKPRCVIAFLVFLFFSLLLT